jgi:hypothetical protein
MGPAFAPRCESVDSDHRRCGEVLEASVRQPHIPARTSPQGADALARPFNAGTRRVCRFPCRGVLMLPERLQRLMFALRLQGHMARGGLRLGTLSTRLTVPTVLISELDPDDRVVPPIAPRAPR